MKHIYKRLGIMMFALILVFSLLPQTLSVSQVKSVGPTFAGGAGTSEDPYRIETWEHFNNVRSNHSSHFILMNDLTSSTTGYDTYASASANSNKGWTPIPNFTGVFDGGGKTISDLTVNQTYTENETLGIFSMISEATIKNLTLTNVSLQGGKFSLGSLAGYSLKGLIDNVSLVNSTLIGNTVVGGLIGNQFGGSIINSTVSGSTLSQNAPDSVSGIGGVLGYQDGNDNNKTQIIFTKVLNTTINGKNVIGGLVGQSGTTLAIKYSHADSVTLNASTRNNATNQYVGGLIGQGGNIEQSFSTGTMLVESNDIVNMYIGGLIGSSEGNVKNSYSSTQINLLNSQTTVTSQILIGGLVGLATGSIENSYFNIATPLTTTNSTFAANTLTFGGIIASGSATIAASAYTYGTQTYVENEWLSLNTQGNKLDAGILIGSFADDNQWDIKLSSQHNGTESCAIWHKASTISIPLLWYQPGTSDTCFDSQSNNNNNSSNQNPSPIIYTPIEVTLTLDASGGRTIDPINLLSGSELTLPTPTRPGYRFEGWYWNSQYSMPFVSSVMPYGNVTLFAKWALVQQVTYVLESQVQVKATRLEDKVKLGSLDGVESLVIELEVEEVALPNSFKRTVERNLADNDQILVLTYDLALYKTITPLTGAITRSRISNDDILGTIEIYVPVPSGYQANQLVIVFIDEDGSIKPLSTRLITEDGVAYLVFETDHFSYYGVVETDQYLDLEEVTPPTSDSSNQAWWMILSGLVLVLISKKKQENLA